MTDCLFCKIIKKEIPAKFEFEDELVVAIQDIHPQAPNHLLIIPKRHIERISDAAEGDAELLGQIILRAKDIAKQKKISDGFRLIFNNGELAGQSVFHIHLHLLGGRRMSWPPG
ncbi:MAG: histidine triad nucleotide-binding protein [Omnitrophica bacterium RIFCSPLOWO2_12_FULL_44_17]|uniref:Histidine triad nucleotide-binding protein n=1 Tax=Candidatus Danuiimicrobium aquiferis TaxID=1801832 RepID=A0A1G1L198_9BACT|nr:MAG: histidine triad nucleotide-binding protein [Omnitrophica bacterium RIFCSPHIGHO2_02_FULL_45_28]OGW88511.1 MAG: histidine triad nucleotide-binding protein [Omnitrophica bacterium RIFCSPHIGHO2_12_FULL_44_12]OGW98927.1 MAG: histidine triad nucleotide-binding protein [Omnitrophica bacterium RIFCSPLOWO2_12_FULL_44_17]OGX01775.1 MAG: histidine triad nucleotide-binding protein [Omnitrophica bacterium RIFCSPLOWO2_02_FULL_44_11]